MKNHDTPHHAATEQQHFMNQHIDIYCERLDASFWAEPINFLTNAAFIIASFFAFYLARKNDQLTLRPLLLTGLIFCIGVGSAAFHSFATLWAMLMDVTPILLFQICFITFYSYDVMRWSWLKILGLLALFFVSVPLSMQFPREWLNGSLEYLPALLFVTGLGIRHFRFVEKERFTLLVAAGIFVVSLIFRSIDNALCAQWHIGTHFLWHCLNSFVLYYSFKAYLMNMGDKR